MKIQQSLDFPPTSGPHFSWIIEIFDKIHCVDGPIHHGKGKKIVGSKCEQSFTKLTVIVGFLISVRQERRLLNDRDSVAIFS